MVNIRSVVRTTTIALLVLGASAPMAAAQEAPPPADAAPRAVTSDGTTPEETGIATPPPGAATAAVGGTYHFGDAALDEVLEAAEARENTPCTISAEGLAAMMLAPTFPETGANTSAAPSPMTLSRWDAQTALHSLSDPSQYRRAFWHPGIGVWQFDSAGGWGLTAFERMDMRQISGVAAQVMVTRYCNAGGSSGGASARASAWGPWVACRSGSCESIFQTIYQGKDQPLAVERVGGIGVTGGVVVDACAPPGMSEVGCRRVDPAAAQGYVGWRANPDGSSSMAPLSYPFSVVEANGLEWRIWKKADTGYGVDIAASRPLGVNPRGKPDPDLPCAIVSPLKWYVNGQLTDSVDRSGCDDTAPPPGFSQTTLGITATYEVIQGDFSGDGLDDVLWYRPGSATDYVWRSPITAPTSTRVTVNGTYEPLVGDFDGNGHDDVFWYRPGSGSEALWAGRSGASIFRDVPAGHLSVNGVYTPWVADFDADGRDDILWFSESSPRNYLWTGEAGPSFSSRSLVLALDDIDAIGDFDGNGHPDLVRHRPGSAPDSFYYGTTNGFTRSDKAVNGSYRLSVGDFDANGTDDLHWQATGAAGDYIWFHEPGTAARATTPRGAPADIGAGSTATVVGDRGAEILWTGSGADVDQYWTFDGRSLTRSVSLYVDDGYQLFAGQWTPGGADVLLYAPGSRRDALWSR